jgi:hypothetical protein
VPHKYHREVDDENIQAGSTSGDLNSKSTSAQDSKKKSCLQLNGTTGTIDIDISRMIEVMNP